MDRLAAIILLLSATLAQAQIPRHVLQWGQTAAASGGSGIPTDYVANWTFDSTTEDSTGSYDVIATNGTPSFVTDGFASGVDSVSLGTSANNYYTISDLTLTGDFSITWWADNKASAYGGYNYLASKETPSHDYISVRDIGANLAAEVLTDGAGFNVVMPTSPSAIPSGWTHYAICRSNGYVVAYMNGTYELTGNVQGTNDQNIDLIFGLGWYAGGFKGECAKVKIYDRLLTDAEITTIYTEENPL